MPDGGLFPDLLIMPPPVGDACARPIGRRAAQVPRQRLRRPPAPSRTAVLLVELRALVTAIGADERMRNGHVARLVARQERALGDIAEALDQIRKRLVAVERAIGVVEPPQAPKPTRRFPS
jgi:hypothetical protein